MAYFIAGAIVALVGVLMGAVLMSSTYVKGEKIEREARNRRLADAASTN